MNLFFDTETTGVPVKKAHWEVDYMMFPYIASMAWKLHDKEHYHVIFQEGRKMPQEALSVHGITTAMSNNKSATKPFADVAEMFLDDAKKSTNIIGHSLYFDISIFKANVIRKFGPKSSIVKEMLVALEKDKRIDTMRETMRHFGKWPKLEELHEWLFKKKFDGAHNALSDVLATERCYLELRKRKLI